MLMFKKKTFIFSFIFVLFLFLASISLSLSNFKVWQSSEEKIFEEEAVYGYLHLVESYLEQ